MGKPQSANAVPAKGSGGGSALRQLRARVQAATAAASRVAKLPTAKGKQQRQHVRSALSAMTRDEANPFELKFGRPKHEVFNRPVKGVKGGSLPFFGTLRLVMPCHFLPKPLANYLAGS